ncbi:hypothetical protein [Kingella negevensis]|uniref:hypothetical protein n=1 Tax=Kingella negevensis TaxID=1522312 RepID=UPI00050A1B9A|nr:hypothetical protein [Kingella negevensis]WII90974.1 hypothetical protein QEO93_11330 [Kingella negevensis]
MKNLILTAINNNYHFWYNQAIPFFLSLADTDFSGNVGVISYGLSEEKQNVLHENGYLVFQAAHHFQDITIDRQWTAAQIAQSGEFDRVALYDTDIWFPNSHLSVFNPIQDPEKLYAAYDVSCANFIFNCAQDYGRDRVRNKINQLMQQNGYPYQVGVLIGYPLAWQKYSQYLDTLLTENQFKIEYGVDTTAFNLYAIDQNGVARLPERYNCLPTWGLQISNLSEQGKQPEKETHRFTLNGEPVEGIHVAGNLRRWGRHDYEYSVYHGERYHAAGKKFRHRPFTPQNIPVEALTHQSASHSPTLIVRQVMIENSIETECQNDEILIRASGYSKFTLHNPHDYDITFQAALQTVLNRHLCQVAIAQQSTGEITDFKFKHNFWLTFTIKSGEEITFYTNDLNPEHSMAQWRFRLVNFAA